MTEDDALLEPGGYVGKVLLGNESLLYQTRLHPLVYGKAVFLSVLLLGLTAFGVVCGLSSVFFVFVGIVVFFLFFKAYMRRAHTEFAVTNLRVILKTGVLSQKALDLQWKSIGGLSVSQSIFGRIFNYGTIGVFGFSAGQQFEMVADPYAFKRVVEEMIQHCGQPHQGQGRFGR